MLTPSRLKCFYIYTWRAFLCTGSGVLKIRPETRRGSCCNVYVLRLFTGCLQYINFLTAAAFLPLLLMAYLNLLQNPGFKKSIILSFAGYMVLQAGTRLFHLGQFIFWQFFRDVFALNKTYLTKVKSFVRYLLLSGLIFVLVASPAIYSYSSILDSYSRYSAQQNLPLTDTGFDPLSFSLFVFPMTTLVKQGVFSNDLAMRNGYISLIAVFALVVSINTKNRLNLVFLCTGITMLLFCAGGEFKQSFYRNLPLLNYVRTNGEYRVFSILFFAYLRE